MRAMKLLFVTAESHPTFRADVRVLFGKYLPRHGVHSDLLTQAASQGAPADWPAGQALLCSPTRSKWKKQWLRFRHDLRMFALARQGYDAIQVRDRVLAGALGLWAARRAGIPFFYWASYPKPESRVIVASQVGNRKPVNWVLNQLRGRLSAVLLYRWVMPRADHVFVQSEAMKQVLAVRGIEPARMTAVPMGVDLDALASAVTPVEHELMALGGRRVVAYSGALDAVRQPGLMLEAIGRVANVCPEVLLLLIGSSPDPAEMAALKRRTCELGLENHVRFTGWLAPEQALGWMAQAELGLSVIPRGVLFDVSSPTKLAEYFALGLPVVANDLPDQALVLAESGVGACVPFESDAVAKAILAALADPVHAKARGQAGRDYVAVHRSYSALAQRLADTYRSLLRR